MPIPRSRGLLFLPKKYYIVYQIDVQPASTSIVDILKRKGVSVSRIYKLELSTH